MSLVSKLPAITNSINHSVVNSFSTSPNLLRLLKSEGIAAASKVRANHTENYSLSFIDKVKKQPRGTCDVAVDSKSNVTLIQWKDSKVV